MELYFTLNNIDDVARQVIDFCGAPSTIALHGQMGAGKTTLVHALCQLLQVEDTVGSPTFSIINQYQTSKGQLVYHIDLYRLKNEDEAIAAGVEDCVLSGDWCFVEWPERAPGLFNKETVHLWLNTVAEDSRELKCTTGME